jgi:hypothetical protein
MRQPHIFTTDFNKPTIITAQQYGTKVSVELDHSDTSLDELMDAFETLVVGLGYHNDAWKEWILDRADEYHQEDAEQEVKDPYTYEDFKRDEENAVRSIIKSKLNEVSKEEEEALRYAAEHETPPFPFATEREVEEWSEKDMQTLIDAINEFAEPNENLKEAKKNYDKKVKSKK